MVRSFLFSESKLVGQDLAPDFLKVVLHDDGVHLWVDVSEGSDEEAKGILEGVFDFHPLAVEDCLTPSELPKVDEYENCVFLVIHGVDYSQKDHEFRSTELNVFVGKNFLVTVHRDPMASVAATIERVLRSPASVARAPDRLTYNLLGSLLDHYEPALAELSREVERLEASALRGTSAGIMGQMIRLKGEVQRLRRIVWPQRDVISRIAHGEFKVVRAHLLPYYRDLLDHLVRISAMTDSYRDSLNGVLQIYLSIQQNRTNEHIKFLTVLATLAMPMFLITSFYGMNFRFAEYGWQHGREWVFATTGALTVLLYVFLRRRGA